MRFMMWILLKYHHGKDKNKQDHDDDDDSLIFSRRWGKQDDDGEVRFPYLGNHSFGSSFKVLSYTLETSV